MQTSRAIFVVLCSSAATLALTQYLGEFQPAPPVVNFAPSAFGQQGIAFIQAPYPQPGAAYATYGYAQSQPMFQPSLAYPQGQPMQAGQVPFAQPEIQPSFGYAQGQPMQAGAQPAGRTWGNGLGCGTTQISNPVPTAPGVETLEVSEVQQCLSTGQCVLADTRGEDRSSGTIAGAVHAPASDPTAPFADRARGYAQQWAASPLVVFHCQFSAHRAPTCANDYQRFARPGQRVAIMRGGFREWECQGLPVNGGGGSGAAADAFALSAGQAFAYGR